MARQIPWTAWILFFAGLPMAFAGHPGPQTLCRYFGFGWGSGYHTCNPNAWYVPGWNCCSAPSGYPDPRMAPPWDGSMGKPASQAAARYYMPPMGYQPNVTPHNAQATKIIPPSTLQ